MPWPELLALAAFATAMSFTPGPNTTLAAAMGANHGLRHAMPFVLAVPVGWAGLLLACSAGLGGLLQLQPALKQAVTLLGVAYLLWLAWKLAHTTALAGTPTRGLDVGFGQGVLLQFVNIKAWMNALLVSAGWVAAAESPLARLLVVLPVMMAFGLASNLSYALVGAALRGWLAQGRRLLWFNRGLAAVLVATAAWLVSL